MAGKQISIRLSEQVHQQLKVLCVQQKTTIQAVALSLLVRWIAGQSPQAKEIADV